MSTISMHILEKALALAAEHVRQTVGDSVYIEHDYFWSVPADHLYNIDQPPGDLTLGQLSECLQQIESLVNEPGDVIAYHMVWLGELLKAVGHKVVG